MQQDLKMILTTSTLNNFPSWAIRKQENWNPTHSVKMHLCTDKGGCFHSISHHDAEKVNTTKKMTGLDGNFEVVYFLI